MIDCQYQQRIDSTRARAHGRWPDILLALGLDERMVKRRRNMPCPFCGGEDRFQFTDKFGEGNYICRHCGAGGGFQLAQQVLGLNFHECLLKVEQYLHLDSPRASASAPLTAERMGKLIGRIWNEAREVVPGDEVDRYLAGRGLRTSVVPSVLRFHPSLGYYEKDESGKSRLVAEHPAMLAAIQGVDGNMVSLHRTYLHEGKKLAVKDAKKVLSSGIAGSAVRLYAAEQHLAITEGIEKSIAVHLATALPTWAALSAGNLEKLWLPATVTAVSIYADNDADGDFAGQVCAYALARRLKHETGHGNLRQVRVFVPKVPGIDWSDIWFRRHQNQGHAS